MILVLSRLFSESSDNDSSSELLLNKSTGDTSITSNSVPAGIAQSKYHSPIQPILKTYPRTTFGTGKNSRNRSFSYHRYSKFPFIEFPISKDAVFCYACHLFPHPTAFTEPVFTSQGVVTAICPVLPPATAIKVFDR